MEAIPRPTYVCITPRVLVLDLPEITESLDEIEQQARQSLILGELMIGLRLCK